MRIFKVKSKKGITLVESVFAVVILAILTTGVLSLLTAGGVQIEKISQEANAHSQASQKMDLVIAAISNGYGQVTQVGEGQYTLDLTAQDEGEESPEAIDLAGVTVVATADLHADNSLRGWYLEVTYMGVTLTGFASDTEGVFD